MQSGRAVLRIVWNASLLKVPRTSEDNGAETAEPIKISEKAAEKSPEENEDSGETLGGKAIQPSADPEEIKRIGDEIHQQTEDFAAKHCRVDREQMQAMLDTVKHSGSVAGGSDNTFGGERYKDWYNSGYAFVVYKKQEDRAV